MSQKFLRLPLRRARGNQPTYQGVWAKHFTPPLGRPLVTGITGDREMGLLRGVSTSAPGLAHALPGPRECNETRPPQTRLCGRAAAGIRSRRNLARMWPQQEPPAGLRRTPSGVARRAGARAPAEAAGVCRPGSLRRACGAGRCARQACRSVAAAGARTGGRPERGARGGPQRAAGQAPVPLLQAGEVPERRRLPVPALLETGHQFTTRQS